MKNTDEVKKALAILKDNAETDFEKLAVSRLETALTNPPRVEVIDENHQSFNQIVFKKAKDNHFRVSIQMHRAVWEYYHGEIPDGYVVHHVDFNSKNNNLNNLVLMTYSDHSAIHGSSNAACKKKKKFVCAFCGKEFEAINSGNNQFCSVSCLGKYRYRNKDKEKRACVICGKVFETSKYRKSKTCSHHCACVLRGITMKKEAAKTKNDSGHNDSVIIGHHAEEYCQRLKT